MSPPNTVSSPDRASKEVEAIRLEFQNTRIHLTLPESNLSIRMPIDVLRVFEILSAFRGMSPYDTLEDRWHVGYRDYLRTFELRAGKSSSRAESENLKSQHGARSPFFELWLRKILDGRQLFPIESIDHGSYELVLHAVNLAAVFGLQNYGVLKDTVQWVAGAMQSVVRFTPDIIDAPYETKQTRSATSETLRSGPSAAILLTPELIRALRDFDDVEFLEETKSGIRRVRIRLSRHSS